MSQLNFSKIFASITSNESRFVNAILNKNYDSAKSKAFDLYKKKPSYLLFYYLITRKENKAILLKLLNNISSLDQQVVYFLLKDSNFTYQDLQSVESKVNTSNFIGFCLKKEYFLKKYEKLDNCTNKLLNDSLQIESNNNTERNDNIEGNIVEICNTKIFNNLSVVEQEQIKKELEETIDLIDDYALYNFALLNKIALAERKGINFKWYKILKDKDISLGIETIMSFINFDDIKRVLDCCNINSSVIENIENNLINKIGYNENNLISRDCNGLIHENKNSLVYVILIRYLLGDNSMDLLKQYFSVLFENKSFISVKALLTLLISTQNENLLVLALFLSGKYTFNDNYEIALINMFLSRYFLLIASIRKSFGNLEVKNSQHLNLAYVWSDPMIVSNVKMVLEIDQFKRELNKIVLNVEDDLEKLINNNVLAVALSSLELREELQKSIMSQEIKNNKIISVHKNTMFSTFLGEKCRFLFDKITVKDERIKEGTIPTLRTVPLNKFSNDIFSNEFMKIEDDDFIQSFVTAINVKIIKRK